jgi:hypothetical protein
MINLKEEFIYFGKNRALICFTQASKRYIPNHSSAVEINSKSENKLMKYLIHLCLQAKVASTATLIYRLCSKGKIATWGRKGKAGGARTI